MKGIRVVCGIVWKNGKVFIARRNPEKFLGGFWEFPGGKIEAVEDPITALRRELHEEMGMVISDIRYFGNNIHKYETFVIDLIAYECAFVKATFDLRDHDSYKFVTIGSLHDFSMAPADEFFVKVLNQKPLLP